MKQLSRERIEQYISDPLEYGLTRSEQMEMARRLLAVEGQEPVVYPDKDEMLKRWLAYGRGMQSAGSDFPRHLIVDTEAVLAAPQPAPVAQASSLTKLDESLICELLSIAKNAALEADQCASHEFNDDSSEHTKTLEEWGMKATSFSFLIDGPLVTEIIPGLSMSRIEQTVAQPVQVPDELTREDYKRRFMDEDDFDNTFRGGWNACRAAMLAAEPISQPYKLPDGYVLVPVEPTMPMLDEFDSIIDYGAEDSKDAWSRLLAAAWVKSLPAAPQEPTKCWCHACRPVTMTDMRFVVCPECGNKRCPHANDHRNACSGSNKPGQEGSAYPEQQEPTK